MDEGGASFLDLLRYLGTDTPTSSPGRLRGAIRGFWRDRPRA